MFRVTEHAHYLDLSFLVEDSANALSLAVARELSVLVRTHRRWSKPVVVRSLHPRVFCSGGNLSDYKKLKGKAAGLKVNREITRALDTFQAWPVVKLALIEGDVFGGGLEWLARFDFRWSSPSAMFGFWQRRLGLSFGWGGGAVWAERLGEATVRSLLVEGRLLSSFEAQRLGIVDRVSTQFSDLVPWCEALSAAGVMSTWKAKREASFFGGLWMGPAHKAILQRWK